MFINKTEAIEAATTWANGLIARYEGTPIVGLPHGERWDEKSCPLATAITSAIDGAEVRIGSKKWNVYVGGVAIEAGANPPEVKRFVRLFDRGRLPHLDKRTHEKRMIIEKAEADASEKRRLFIEQNRARKIASLETALAATPAPEPHANADVLAPTAMV